MIAQVTRLRYWKSEHDEQTCEDAYAENIAAGLFAVTDGAGTTLFSNIWARILVEFFLNTPLMSNDPFEVEWWVRQAQERYMREAPDPGKMVWNALQKAQNQGSHSTLATLRISKCERDSAQVELLVFGDSCVLIGKSGVEQVYSFPLLTPSDFEQAPICVPSKRTIFNRYFHQCHLTSIKLEPGNMVVLATDAVSKWIISAGNGRCSQPKVAFEEVIAQTPNTWAAFITACRSRGEMIDDDSTALIITLKQEAFAGGLPLGATTEHSKAIREDRKRDFTRATDAQNKELLAIAIGDGVDLSQEGITLSPELVQQARRVSDALQAVLQVLRQEINKPDAAEKVRLIWQQYEPLLLEEPCAANLRQTLMQLGVLSQPSSVPKQQQVMQTQQEPEYLDTQVVTFTPQEAQCILLAHKRERAKQLAQTALQNMLIEHMAKAYEAILTDPELISPDELNLLQLAHTFIKACQANKDEAILTAFEGIRHSRFYASIRFSLQEKARIKQAWEREMAATQIMPANSQPNEDHDEQEHRSWLSKFIWWKEP